jgi:hypothetical protein
LKLWEKFDITEEQVKSLRLTWELHPNYPLIGIIQRSLPGYDVEINFAPYNDPARNALGRFCLRNPWDENRPWREWQYFDSLFEALLAAERHVLEYGRKIQDIFSPEAKPADRPESGR